MGSIFTMAIIQKDLLVEQTNLVKALFEHGICDRDEVSYDGHFLEDDYLKAGNKAEWEEWIANVDDLQDQYDSFADYLDNQGGVEVKEYRDIDEWWLITDRMQRWLEDRGEPILDTIYGTWWGRTENGPLDQDDALRSILAEMDAKYPGS